MCNFERQNITFKLLYLNCFFILFSVNKYWNCYKYPEWYDVEVFNKLIMYIINVNLVLLNNLKLRGKFEKFKNKKRSWLLNLNLYSTAVWNKYNEYYDRIKIYKKPK